MSTYTNRSQGSHEMSLKQESYENGNSQEKYFSNEKQVQNKMRIEEMKMNQQYDRYAQN